MNCEQFENCWQQAKTVGISLDAPMPTANFFSFPERNEGEVKSGVICGLHFSFEEITEFYADWEICMITLDKFNGREFNDVISGMKSAHGEFVYMVKMFASDDVPVYFYESGVEARTMTYMCDIKRIEL